MATTVTPAVSNNIGLASRYLPILDEVYKASSKTAILDTAEGNVRYDTGNWHFSLLTSLTWQRDLNRTDPNDEDTYDKPICYSPKLSYTLTAIAAWKDVSLTLSHMHVGERMWSYADPQDILKPYNNVDMKLSVSDFMSHASHLSPFASVGLCLEVLDLFDEQYEHIPRYPMPGRNYRLTLTLGI